MERLTIRNSDGSVSQPTGTTVYAVFYRLAAYEDTGLEPEVCANYKKFEDEAISKGVTFKRIIELMEAEKDGRLVVLPPNDPLSLEKLREMDGEPVWVCVPDDPSSGRYGIVSLELFGGPENSCVHTTETNMYFAAYGKTWLAYRHRPEEKDDA